MRERREEGHGTLASAGPRSSPNSTVSCISETSVLFKWYPKLYRVSALTVLVHSIVRTILLLYYYFEMLAIDWNFICIIPEKNILSFWGKKKHIISPNFNILTMKEKEELLYFQIQFQLKNFK